MLQTRFRVLSLLLALCLVFGLLTPASAASLSGEISPSDPGDAEAGGTEFLVARSLDGYVSGTIAPVGWVGQNLTSLDGKDTQVKKEGLASFRFKGQAGGITKAFSQTINTTAVGGETMIFSFWASAASLPVDGVCRAQVLFYNGATVAGSQTVNCQTGSYAWAQTKVTFTAPGTYTKIIVKFFSNKASGTLWLDFASLVVMAPPTTVRWFVGLGTGTNPEQIVAQQDVVDDFNASQKRIQLVLEVVPWDSARETLEAQIAADNAPDIVGPVGWGGSHYFYGEWLDLAPLIQQSGFNTGIFPAPLVNAYKTETGQVALPFASFPGAMYYQPKLFDKAGLAYPPQSYGKKYVLDGQAVDWSWDTVTTIARRLTLDSTGKNATQPGFDRTKIVQVGYAPQWQSIMSIATFHAGAADVLTGSSQGNYHPNFPTTWKDSWKWYYNGMWGAQPFMLTGPQAGTPAFAAGNLFNSGKAAMALSQAWYLCCLGEFANAGYTFQLGVQPMGADGKVHGRVDMDSFRMLKGSKHYSEAFDALKYLVTTGADKLLPVYGAMPSIPSKTGPYLQQKAADYPFVTQASWQVFVKGLYYPDAPSAEQYLPNWSEAMARIGTFGDLLANTPNVGFDAQYQKLLADLEIIYNK